MLWPDALVFDSENQFGGNGNLTQAVEEFHGDAVGEFVELACRAAGESQGVVPAAEMADERDGSAGEGLDLIQKDLDVAGFARGLFFDDDDFGLLFGNVVGGDERNGPRIGGGV